MTDSNKTLTPTGDTNSKNLSTSDKEISGIIDDIKTITKHFEDECDKIYSNSHSYLCFARAILYLILTGCSFIPLELEDDEVISMAFWISSIIITIMSYFILKQKRKEPEVLQGLEWVFIILFFLCLFVYFRLLLSTIFRRHIEIHFVLLFPCAVDLFCGILYKFCHIKNHYKVYLPIFIVAWLTYVGVNIKLEMWDSFALVFGLFTINLSTRLATVYCIFSGKDERLLTPIFGTSLFLACHFILLSSWIALMAFLSFQILKCLGYTLKECCKPKQTAKYVLIRVE